MKAQAFQQKRMLLVLVFCFSFSNFHSYAQSPFWQDVFKAGGTDNEAGLGIAKDANGNTYVTGVFKSSSLVFGNTVLSSAGDYDFFIVKYDSLWNVEWMRSAGGANEDRGNAIAVDAAGNAYVTGAFASDSITFGNITLVSSNGTYDIFIVKYDPQGNVSWAKSMGAPLYNSGNSIALDPNDNIYVTGSYNNDTISFGNNIILVSDPGSSTNIFVAKYDSTGSCMWARNAAGQTATQGNGITADANGNSYVTGDFATDSVVFGNFTLINNGTYSNVFIVKYDSSGNVVWAKSFGGNNLDQGTSISADAIGNTYTTGFFYSSSVIFGSNITITNSGLADVFVVKLDSSGNVIWAKEAGATPNDKPTGITHDNNSNCYVTGYFGFSLFIIKYDLTGNLAWVKTAVGGMNYSNAITLDANNDIYITGNYSDSITFRKKLYSSGVGDIFVTKLAYCYADYSLHPDITPHVWIALNLSAGAPPISYNWSWGDGFTSTGTAPSHYYVDSGYYNICVSMMDNNGCSDTYCDSSTLLHRQSSALSMAIVNVLDSTTLISSIGNLQAAFEYTVYPNPGDGNFTISGLHFPVDDIEIYNMLGEKVYNDKYGTAINISDLPEGIYIIKVVSNKETIVKKLIVKK